MIHTMEGIRFLTNEKGKRTDVVIDLDRYGATLEDFFDSLTFKERQNEEVLAFETLVADLRNEGKYVEQKL